MSMRNGASPPDLPVTFDTSGLSRAGEFAWHGDNADVVQIVPIDLRPDLPAPLERAAVLRRELAIRYARSGVGLVECDPATVDGLPVLRQVLKVRHPQQRHGLVFLGSLLAPKLSRSVVLKAQCMETGATGMREAFVLLKVGPDAAFGPSPYAPDVDLVALGGLPTSVADGVAYDAAFPDHPLSRLRRLLDRLAATARFTDRFRALPPYPGPIGPPRHDLGRPYPRAARATPPPPEYR
jgi:hypothetical protein